ncbi:MAG: hypothetical protein IJU93_01080 [Lachnospiraceae bacterium]|nr:hypothetical protein [Lachnospiraceae bacterium]
MGKVTYSAGDRICSSSDSVDEIRIILQGTVKASGRFTFQNGYMLGMDTDPHGHYGYDYVAEEECTLFTYPYNGLNDVENIVRINPKICHYLTSATVMAFYAFIDAYEKAFAEVRDAYDEVQANYEKYMVFAQNASPIAEIENMGEPMHYQNEKWVLELAEELKANNDKFKKEVYPLGIGLCIAIVKNLSAALRQTSTSFKSTLRLKEILTQLNESLKIKLRPTGAGENDEEIPVITNALDTVLGYSEATDNLMLKFKELITKYKSQKDRNDTSDDMRRMKKEITAAFFELYKLIFLKARKSKFRELPMEIRLFLLFGFVDEELAGVENTYKLEELAVHYEPDVKGRVFTVYEWLQRIYDLKDVPSKNEFDMDFEEYLKDEIKGGRLTEANARKIYKDSTARLEFELQNMFTLGNKVTFGRILSYVPVFDSQNVLRPIENSYIDAKTIGEQLENVVGIDFSCFCRETVYSKPEIGVVKEYVQVDVPPRFILMPNFGSRASLWQEIEGKKRTTSSRMLLPIMLAEDLEKFIIQLCAEFRWEMCKRMQGVHWNDVTDPSLTSMYCDFLQFYRKNHDISPETREKVKQQLAKANNNYKTVFVSDYYSYIKYEVAGSPRLNKVSRDIIFTFCPPAKEIRNRIGDNPQYADIVKRYDMKINQKLHTLDNLKRKLTKEKNRIPDEIEMQYQFLKK